jgi:hypothetical protein
MGRSCSRIRAVKFRQHHRPDVRHLIGHEDHGPLESARRIRNPVCRPAESGEDSD